MAAGSVLFAAAALVGTVAGSAAAAVNPGDSRGWGCDTAASSGTTWQRVERGSYWAGTNNHAYCKKNDWRWNWLLGGYHGPRGWNSNANSDGFRWEN
jgi:hypothetical protein